MVCLKDMTELTTTIQCRTLRPDNLVEEHALMQMRIVDSQGPEVIQAPTYMAQHQEWKMQAVILAVRLSEMWMTLETGVTSRNVQVKWERTTMTRPLLTPKSCKWGNIMTISKCWKNISRPTSAKLAKWWRVQATSIELEESSVEEPLEKLTLPATRYRSTLLQLSRLSTQCFVMKRSTREDSCKKWVYLNRVPIRT